MLMRSLEQLGDEIAELSVHLDAATVRLLDLIREFDIREGWNNGFRSCAAWLAWRVGLDMGAARERVRVARALDGLPRLAEALSRGELSYAKVRALTRVATPETELRLLAVGRAGTAEHVERIVRGWRRVDRQAEALEAKLRHDRRALHVYQDVDGTVVIRGRIAPEAGAVPVTFGASNVSAETRSFEQQQADALVLVAETALHHGIDPGTPGERYQVVVHVDADVLANAEATGQSVLEGGARVPAETSQRLACDASRVEMRHDADGVIVESAPGRARAPREWRTPVPLAPWVGGGVRSTASKRSERRRSGSPRPEHGGGCQRSRAHSHAWVGRQVVGRRLGDRCSASEGQPAAKHGYPGWLTLSRPSLTGTASRPAAARRSSA